MSRTVDARREALDNIAVGSAITTRERTLPTQSAAPPAGALPPDFTAVGNNEKIAVGQSYGSERVIAGSALMAGERLGP
jgi:hypothetical protein